MAYKSQLGGCQQGGRVDKAVREAEGKLKHRELVSYARLAS